MYLHPRKPKPKEVAIPRVVADVPAIEGPVEEHKLSSGGWHTVAFMLVNCALGAGVLHYPAAYDEAGGLLIGTAVQAVIIFILGPTALALAYCSDAHGDNTYHEVLESCCGTRARNVSAWSVLVSYFGICIALLVIIGDLTDRIFASAYGAQFCHEWYMSRHFTIVTTAVVFILPLCLMKNVTLLQRASKVGVVAMLYPVFLTVYSFYTIERPEDLHLRTEPDSIIDFVVNIPVFCFAYQMHEMSVPVYAGMEKRGIVGFAKALTVALAFLFMAYVTVGCFGYATYGHTVKPNIMQMFNASDPIVLFGIVALMIKMVVTYPLIVFFGREELESMYIRYYNLSPEEASKGERKRTFVAMAIWLLVPTLLAISPIDLGIALKFLGCLSMFNVYIFPGLCLVGVVRKKPGYLPRERLMQFLGCVVIIFGLLLSGTVLVRTIVHHIPKSGASHKCS
ncbi:sodium-coupled neutral amino acid transporter 7-like isoform X1 [Ornithodoros turicata]|uniref:sodium-coupled neutral amino acid transporter 7-like isoform X1 n=1 Tax=Ornithodoros turicata TaxID=34597 RepID=UPI00313A2DFE